jgi:hypothetical protein
MVHDDRRLTRNQPPLRDKYSQYPSQQYSQNNQFSKLRLIMMRD